MFVSLLRSQALQRPQSSASTLRLDLFAENSRALDHPVALAAAFDALAPLKKARGAAMLAGSRHFFVHGILLVSATIVSKCWHFGHSNVWSPCPGVSR